MLDCRINVAQVAAGVAVPEELPVIQDCLARFHVVRLQGTGAHWWLLQLSAGCTPVLGRHACRPVRLARWDGMLHILGLHLHWYLMFPPAAHPRDPAGALHQQL